MDVRISNDAMQSSETNLKMAFNYLEQDFYFRNIFVLIYFYKPIELNKIKIGGSILNLSGHFISHSAGSIWEMEEFDLDCISISVSH